MSGQLPRESNIPTPERPDVEDAYLRCTKCSWVYTLDCLAVDERCGECGGIVVYAVGGWAS